MADDGSGKKELKEGEVLSPEKKASDKGPGERAGRAGPSTREREDPPVQ
jgi:hypothetical protein